MDHQIIWWTYGDILKDAFIIAKHNFIIINVFFVSSLLQRSSFPLIRTAPEWWHTPVVDSLKTFARQKPCASCHLSRKEPYNGEKLLVATACVIMDEDWFMSYTDKFKYLSSLLEKRMDDKVDINGRIKQAIGQFQMIRENILPTCRTYNFPSDLTLQCSYYHHGSIRMRQFLLGRSNHHW